MNTTLTTRLVAAALAVIATSSMLLTLVWLAQPDADTGPTLARQPLPVVVASTDGR